jgi:hypothetical protein
MAITNPEAIRFCNEKIRVAADRLSQAYYFAKALKSEWDANSMGSLLPVSSDVVRDSASPTDDSGTGGDGRHVITSNDANGVLARCTDLIADLEASSSAKLNTLLAVAVNVNP